MEKRTETQALERASKVATNLLNDRPVIFYYARGPVTLQAWQEPL